MEMEIPSYLILLAFLVFLLKKLITKLSNPRPGPWGLPLIGNIHQLVGHQPHHRLTELAKTYGPIMHIQLGQLPLVVVSSAEIAKQILKTQEFQFVGRPSLLAADIMLYKRSDISFAPYGQYWRQMKKIAVVELLSAKRVQSFKPVIEDEVSDLINFLYWNAGSAVNLSRKLSALGNSIIAITSMGKKFKQQEALLRVIDDAIRAAGGFSVADAFPSFKLLHAISGTSSTLHRAHRQVDNILEQVIREHKANKSNTEPDNILDVLLDIQEHENLQLPITTDNIKAIILDIFAGASDTSLVTAEWAISEMVKNPRAMQKAQEEIRRVFHGKENVNDEDLRELKYLKLVIKETLRLHPPVALIPRECGEKYQVNGFDIYAKTKVLVNAWAIGRDPNSWTHPDRFYPERFVDNSVDFKGSNFELIPFGAGKRMCPGIVMSLAMIEPLLARMLYHFDWKLPADAEPESLDMADAFGLVTKRKMDLVLIPTPFHPN